MHMGTLTRSIAYSLVAAAVLATSAGSALAQAHDHAGLVAAPPHKPTAQENELVQTVRDATAKFKDVTNVAGPGEGYELNFGCVSGGDYGAMGLHYINMQLVGDGEVRRSSPRSFSSNRHRAAASASRERTTSWMRPRGIQIRNTPDRRS
jgi:hypothetical protein